MRRPSIGVAALFGVFTVLILSTPASTQDRRRPRVTIEQLNGREVAAGEVLVTFRREPRTQELAQIAAQIDADLVERIGRAGVHRLHSRSLDTAALMGSLGRRGDLAYTEPNYVVRAFTDPNDVGFPQLWGLRNAGQTVNGLPGLPGADIHAAPAWDISVGSTANVVAVIDTGIDYTHPDLTGNMWSAPQAFTVTIGSVQVTCPAGTHGFNAIALTCDPMDDHNHGTHVSGTIGASGNNGLGVVGVNWIAQLMGIKFLDADGSGTVADAINGIEFAIQAKQAFAGTGGANVRVLSNSWGGSEFSQALLDEITAANTHDMLFVAAAGNSGFSNDILPTYPASYEAPNVIAVAATTNTDSRAWFSNYGAASVHLGAPGVDILSTTIGNTYAFFSGTSMATPHVAGSASLVLSRCALGTAALKDALLTTTESVPALASITITGGRLDVNSAIRSCVAPPATPTGLTALAGSAQVTLVWSGAAGTTSFNVKRSVTSGGPYALVASGGRAKTYVDNAVVNGTTYYYVVSAANSLGESGNSNEAIATPKTPADLVISALTVPFFGGAGTTIVLTDTTRNQGAGTAGPSTTRFYLSRNTQIDAGDTLLNGAHAVPAIASGATSVASVSVDIPNDVGVGFFYIIAKADADNVENETQESNNTLARLFSIGPDLAISSLTAPATAAAGGTIAVSDTVKNQGGGVAGASTTRFYLSTSNVVDSSAVLLSDGRSVPGLAPGGTSSGTTTVLIPSTVTTGSFYLIAKADADNAVNEAQESNNTATRLVQIGGDLVVSSLIVPSKAGAGSTIVISDTTTNQGTAATAASVTRFYFSTNVLLDASDTLLPAARAVPGLAAGIGSTGSTMVTIPSALAVGTYYIIAKADADNAVVEAQEANNTAVRAIQIGGDLVVSTLTVPSRSGAGGTILISDTTINQGAGGVAASVTRFYLSVNAVLAADDTLLAGNRMVPDLAAGAGSSGSTMVTIPTSVAPGAYYVIAKADADDAVAETQEWNNSTARLITIGPDVVVSSMSASSPAVAGSTVLVTDVVQNQGSETAGPSITRFYLSIDIVLDASDPSLVGSRSVPALTAGTSSSGATSVTIPEATAPGTYVLIARADADGAVAEGQENNNTRWLMIQVKASAAGVP